MRRRIPFIVLVLAFLPLGGNARGQVSIEYQLLGLVNGGRSGSLPMHSGLVGAARAHSRDMASSGLTHSGALGRISGAAPDPSESNGAPDDGFTGTWCENIAYVTGGSEGDVAARIYDGWRNSPGHLHCMTDPEMTTAGIGVYFDGDTWWATMEAMQDTTPPGSGPREPRAPDASEVVRTEAPSTPAAEERTPDPTAAGTSPPAITRDVGGRMDTAPTPLAVKTSAARSPLGWPEAMAALGLAVVGLLAYRRITSARGGG